MMAWCWVDSGETIFHDGLEHVLCFVPARSGKGVGLVVPTLLAWPGSVIVHDRRLDRITRQMERLERDVGISVETIAVFIRFWLMATPSLPERTQAAARAKGGERYEGFLQALGRRLAKGPSFIREVSPGSLTIDAALAANRYGSR